MARRSPSLQAQGSIGSDPARLSPPPSDAPEPSPERYQRLIQGARQFTSICRQHAKMEQISPPNDWSVIYRQILERAKLLNKALGGRFGTEEMRRPVGWDPSIGLAVGRIAAQFERVVGREATAWGLRSESDPSLLIDLPEPGSSDPGIFGDLRFRPFTFEPRTLAALDSIEAATNDLDAAWQRDLARHGWNRQDDQRETVEKDHKPATEASSAAYYSELQTKLGSLIKRAELYATHEPGTAPAAELIVLWRSIGEIEDLLSVWGQRSFQPYEDQALAIARLNTAFRSLPPRADRLSPFHDEVLDRFTTEDRLKALRLVHEMLAPPMRTEGISSTSGGPTQAVKKRRDPVHDGSWLSLEDRAIVQVRAWAKQGMTNIPIREIARALGCHHSSLQKLPTLRALLKSNIAQPLRGYRDASSGNIECEEDLD